MTQRWPVRHPGIGIIYYGSEQEARVAAGTAAEMLPPEQVGLGTAGVDLTALERGGTPAPWHLVRDGQELRVESVVEGDVIATWTRAECDTRDPELIVAARNALPELLAEVRRLASALTASDRARDSLRTRVRELEGQLATGTAPRPPTRSTWWPTWPPAVDQFAELGPDRD